MFSICSRRRYKYCHPIPRHVFELHLIDFAKRPSLCLHNAFKAFSWHMQNNLMWIFSMWYNRSWLHQQLQFIYYKIDYMWWLNCLRTTLSFIRDDEPVVRNAVVFGKDTTPRSLTFMFYGTGIWFLLFYLLLSVFIPPLSESLHIYRLFCGTCPSCMWHWWFLNLAVWYFS